MASQADTNSDMQFSTPAMDQLARMKDPHIWTEEKEEIYFSALKESVEFHYENNSTIRNFYALKDFSPQDLTSPADISKLPGLGVTAMKYHLLLTRAPDLKALNLTSSGTRGQKTQVWFDQPSLDRVQSLLRSVWEQEGLTTQTPTNYLMFIYNPDDAKDLGIAFSVKNQTQFAPVKDIYYAINKDSNDQWQFDKNAVLQKLKEFAEDGSPARISGIPSFMHEFLDTLTTTISLPVGSTVLTGGGWKAAEDKKVSKEVFRNEINEKFGISPELVRDGYGMAEHSSPYIECKDHRFHIPAFNRIIIRDPITLNALPDGEVGLIELQCPFNTMMPNQSVLSTDLGKIDVDPCTCGYNAPTFTLVGRGGLSKHKGCAITANDLVKRGS